MTKAPAFQFYPKDWLSSIHVQLMTPAQEGAYIRLLCFCWDSGDCSIPDDDQELAIISRLGEGWLNGGSILVRKCFVPHPKKPGFLTNQRMLDEAAKQEQWRKKSKVGGEISARKRAEKKQDSKGGSAKTQPDNPPPVEPKSNSSSASASSTASFNTPSLPENNNSYPTTYREHFDEVYDSGVRLFPHLATKEPSAIRKWLDGGGGVKEICLLFEKSKGKDVGSWDYFTPAVDRAIAARRHLAPPAGVVDDTPLETLKRYREKGIATEAQKQRLKDAGL